MNNNNSNIKNNNIVHIVHCIDTEGPLSENLNATFKRLKNIFGVDLRISKNNLHKIQNKKLDFGGKENLIAKVFNPKLLSYNDNWSKIKKMHSNISSVKFRNKYKDSFGNGWIYNWFIMDHVGFVDNPRKKDLGFHKIWKKYKSFYSKKNIFNDGFHFHHHPIPFSKSALHCATHFFNHTPMIYEILNRKLIDLSWFPSVYRPGFHSIRADSHWFLEQFIPFDYSNQRIKKISKNHKHNLQNGRFGDWRRAPFSWSPYHPDHDDYQKKGNCRRWTARCLNIGTRLRLLEKKDIQQAFVEASNGKPVILSFANHDFRNIEDDIDNVANLIKEVSNTFPKIKYKWCEAKEAMRGALNLKNNKKIKIFQNIKNNILKIRFNKKIYGPQPYLAIKTKDNKYFHDNFDIQNPFFEWSYTFDEQTIPINKIKKIAWAANDNYGNTYISMIDPKEETLKLIYLK
jgi:hypothetical protein|tara:strand:- start:437 stop:1807 length:1371 start_codon:yes stop_codon:yes gene_type:complete